MSSVETCRCSHRGFRPVSTIPGDGSGGAERIPKILRARCETSLRRGDARRLYIWPGRRLKDATDATELVGMQRGKRPWILLGRDSLARMHATRNGLVTGTCYTSPESGYARDGLSIQSQPLDRLRLRIPPPTLSS
jgi:hypothetical protein